MTEKQSILLVDDSADDVELMHLAFKWAKFNSPVHVVATGEEAIDYLLGAGVHSNRDKYPMPTVMLLDLNMPKRNGFDLLAWLGTQPALKRLTVIVLTSSTRPGDVDRAFDLGAHAFLVKPPTLDELTGMMRCLRDWLRINHFPAVGEMPPEQVGATPSGVEFDATATPPGAPIG